MDNEVKEDKLVSYARIIALMAQEGVLEPDAAMTFCRAIVPQLLAELEIMRGVVARAWAQLSSTSELAEGPPPPLTAPAAPSQPPAPASPKRQRRKSRSRSRRAKR